MLPSDMNAVGAQFQSAADRFHAALASSVEAFRAMSASMQRVGFSIDGQVFSTNSFDESGRLMLSLETLSAAGYVPQVGDTILIHGCTPDDYLNLNTPYQAHCAIVIDVDAQADTYTVERLEQFKAAARTRDRFGGAVYMDELYCCPQQYDHESAC